MSIKNRNTTTLLELHSLEDPVTKTIIILNVRYNVTESDVKNNFEML